MLSCARRSSTTAAIRSPRRSPTSRPPASPYARREPRALARTHPIHSAEHALERLGSLPRGSELIRAAKEREDIALVGGAVRDLLLGHWPRELDVTVDGEAARLATSLAAS